MVNWRKFERLTVSEKSCFLLALVFLPATALAIRMIGLKRTQSMLARLARAPSQRTAIANFHASLAYLALLLGVAVIDTIVRA